MKLTGLEVLDTTILRTNIWLKELMQELNWTDRRRTYLALRCVLHAIRDHLPVEGAVQFGEQLPMLLRGLYFEHWDPVGKPAQWCSRDDFLAGLCSYLEDSGNRDRNPETLVRAVFRLLDRKATEGEIEDLRHIVPGGLRDLWPQGLRAA